MPAYHNASAAIHVNGQALDEYQVEYDDSHKLVSCWIPAQVGKEFSIEIRNTGSNDYMKFEVKMDGDFTNAWRLSPQGTKKIDSCQPSPTTYRSFVFSRGQTVDDDEVSVSPTHMAGVGTIVITVFKGKLGSQELITPTSHDIRIPETRRIPEREKKGINTCVALGPVKSRAPQKPSKHRKFIGAVLQAKFIFKYRPLDYLQAQGIAPPPPTALPNDRPQDNNARKRKRSSDEARPKAGPSKATHTNNRTGSIRDLLGVDINTEEGLEMLRALRSKIDQVLDEKDADIRPKKEHKPVVIAKDEVIDLT